MLEESFNSLLTAITNILWTSCSIRLPEVHWECALSYFPLHCQTTFCYLLLGCHFFSPNQDPHWAQRIRPESILLRFRLPGIPSRRFISVWTRANISLDTIGS